VCEGKRPWPNLRHHSGICLEGLRQISKGFSLDNRCSVEIRTLKPSNYQLEAFVFSQSTYELKQFNNANTLLSPKNMA